MLADREASAFLADLLQPDAANLRTLLEKVVGPNSDSDFGRRHGFSEIKSIAEYRRRVPIRNYEGFRSDCERIARGEEKVLTVEPVKRFFATSGSSNKPKLVPVTNSFIKDKSRAFGLYWSLVFRDHPNVKAGRLVTNFSDAGGPKATGPGLPVSSESAYWAGVTAATQRKEPVIPKAVARIPDHEARYYAIARVLLEEPFHAIMALNPSTLLVLFETLEQNGDALIRDVAQGGVSAPLAFGDEARALIGARYAGNPTRAAALEAIAAAHTGGEGARLPTQAVFPGLELAVSWRSPMLAPYLRLLDRHLGGTAGRDYLLMASEGVMAVPIKDRESGGPLAMGVHFYELIPHAAYGSDDPPVLSPEEAKVGEEYVLLLSTSAGLYRYDIGDVVRVARFEGPTPVVEFLHRAGATSSLTGEKLTEPQVTAAVEGLCKKAGLSLESFTLVPSLDGLPHYLLLLEPKVAASPEQLDALLDGLDAALAAENMEYQSKRSSARLGAPELWRVAPGGYAQRKAARIAAGAAELQIKPVHLSRDPAFVAELPIAEKRVRRGP